MPHNVIMPALGMAQDTGKLIAWLKQPGEAVAEGDPLFEVETDKATMEVEAQANGVLAQVTAKDGDDVPVGSVVAVISDSADAAAEPASPAPESESDANSGSTDLPEGKTVIMPALGMAQDTGKVVAWRKAPGDAVAAADVLFEVETDKSVMEVEAGHDGYVAVLFAMDNEDIPVGSPAAIISETKPDNPVQRSISDASAAPVAENSASEETKRAEPAPAPAPKAEKPAPTPAPKSKAATPAGERILASPKLRWLADQEGLDLERLVEHGIEQPFHVEDLELLRSLPASASGAHASASDGKILATLQVDAQVPSNGFSDFQEWLHNETGTAVDARDIWARFATAALRRAKDLHTSTLATEIRQRQKTHGLFADADRHRMSAPLTHADGTPHIIIRDFTNTAVTRASSNTDAAPVLTITINKDDYCITLDYRGEQLSEDEAFELVDGFASRLAYPLHHIL